MFPLTLDEFLDSFPIFRDADYALVESKLKAAHARFAGCAGYPQYHDLVGLYAAHLLACEPGGHTLRLSENDAITAYSVALDELRKTLPFSASVVP